MSKKYHHHIVLVQYLQDVIVPKICHNLARILLRSFLGILKGKILCSKIFNRGKAYISVTRRRLWEEVDV